MSNDHYLLRKSYVNRPGFYENPNKHTPAALNILALCEKPILNYTKMQDFSSNLKIYYECMNHDSYEVLKY